MYSLYVIIRNNSYVKFLVLISSIVTYLTFQSLLMMLTSVVWRQLDAYNGAVASGRDLTKKFADNQAPSSELSVYFFAY